VAVVTEMSVNAMVLVGPKPELVWYMAG